MNNSLGIPAWINQKRLRDYPRLMLFATWLILMANLLLRTGWLGGLGQIIGGDFIMFYSTGRLYIQDPSSIYDYDQQAEMQQSLVSPTVLPGLNPFMNPPYVAPLYSLLGSLPLAWSFVTWTGLMIASVILSAVLMMKIVPDNLKNNGLTLAQLLILILSFFPFVESLQAGQNSGLTLLLMTCLIYFSLKEKHLLAGICAGLMIYKPQYILGFLILWVIWKNIKSLLGFVVVAITWIGIFYLQNGLGAFHEYLDLSNLFILLPYIPGFPAYILVTLYGLLTTIFPQPTQPLLYDISQAMLLAGVLFTAVFAFKFRLKPMLQRTPIIALAILLPLFATPYTLLHDLVILLPGLVLWARYNPQRELLFTTITIYFGTLFLTLLSATSRISLNALLVITLVVLVVWYLVKGNFHPVASGT